MYVHLIFQEVVKAKENSLHMDLDKKMMYLQF